MAILSEIDQKEYSNTVYSKITSICKSKLIEDPYYMLQYERLCRDYWETKLTEFDVSINDYQCYKRLTMLQNNLRRSLQ